MVRTRLEDLRLEECSGAPSLRAEALGRLIQIHFPPDVSLPAHRTSFYDRVHDFARAYFLLARRHEELFRIRMTEVRGTPADVLAQVLETAATSDQLAPLPVPARAAAVLMGINLVTLQQQVGTDPSGEAAALTPDEAADLLMTVLFEGVQASPVLSAYSPEETKSSSVTPKQAVSDGARKRLRCSGAPLRSTVGVRHCSAS